MLTGCFLGFLGFLGRPNGTVVRKAGGVQSISALAAPGSTGCTTPTVAVSAGSTANSTAAVCAPAVTGVSFDVATTGQEQTVTVVAGTIGLSPMLDATLADAGGKVVGTAAMLLNSTSADYSTGVWHTITWTLVRPSHSTTPT